MGTPFLVYFFSYIFFFKKEMPKLCFVMEN